MEDPVRRRRLYSQDSNMEDFIVPLLPDEGKAEQAAMLYTRSRTRKHNCVINSLEYNTPDSEVWIQWLK